MISEADLQEPRSPSSLRAYVQTLKEAVRRDPVEFRRGLMKAGLYKEFLDELLPLSCFAVLAYPEEFSIRLVLGNQGYDAIVYNEQDAEVDRVELTVPHDGRSASEDRMLVFSRGFGRIRSGEPGSDLADLSPLVLETCRRKARTDYSDCTLVVAIEPLTPFEGFEPAFSDLVERLVGEMRAIPFPAKRVYLLLMPDHLIEICD